LDSLPPAVSVTEKATAKRDTAPPTSNDGQHLKVVPANRPPTDGPASGAAATPDVPAKSSQGTTAVARPPVTRPTRAEKNKSGQARRRPNKPPEAAIPYDVYQRLRAVSAEEKRQHRELARPFGAIVMDALEKQAATLTTLWATTEPASAPAEGSLFIRTAAISGTTPPRRRARSMKTITLSGVSGANAQLLDRYAHEWNAGSRAALVEEALRLEFGMPHSPDDAVDSGAS